MAKCLRCGAGNEWLQGKVPNEPKESVQVDSTVNAKAVDLISEKQWQQQIKDLARLLGWKTYHTLRSKGSDPGYPDLILARRRKIGRLAGFQVRWRAPAPDAHKTRLIAVELKVEGKNPTPGQLEWLDFFKDIGAETYVWRPSDLEEVKKVLR